MNIFHERLCGLIAQYNFTSYELARQTGLSAKTICRLQTGEDFPSMESAIALAMFFNVSLDWFFGTSIELDREEAWGGLYYNAYTKQWRASVPSGRRPYLLGHYNTKAEAIAAIKEYQNANAQCSYHVRPGRRNGDRGPGPGLSGPAHCDMGKQLQRDEGFIPGGEEALPPGGPRVLP